MSEIDELRARLAALEQAQAARDEEDAQEEEERARRVKRASWPAPSWIDQGALDAAAQERAFWQRVNIEWYARQASAQKIRDAESAVVAWERLGDKREARDAQGAVEKLKRDEAARRGKTPADIEKALADFAAGEQERRAKQAADLAKLSAAQAERQAKRAALERTIADAQDQLEELGA
jgi:hypothetical protein